MKNNFKNIKNKLLNIEGFPFIMEYLLDTKDIELYIAGGFVRDFFIDENKALKDIDLFYLGNSEKFIQSLMTIGKVSIGPFGSIRWYPYYDGEVYYDVISIVDFNNGVEKCKNIVDVLKQFDITANSVAYSLNTGEFFNPINGLLDIQNKNLRIVRFDYPNEIISLETPISRVSVLWFRILHYSNVLNFEIDLKTKMWLRKNKDAYFELDLFKKYFFIPKMNIKLLADIKA